MPGMTARDRVDVGIVGLGAVAQAVHLPLLARHDQRFRVTAVADLSAGLVDAIGDRHAIPAACRFGSLEAMLAAREDAALGLDAILVLTSGSHGAAARMALDAGLAVLCEKPLALTLAEADALASAEDPTEGRPRLLLGYMKLHDPAVRRAAELEATRGPARSIEVVVLHPASESQLRHAHVLPPATDVPVPQLERLVAENRALLRRALGGASDRLGQLYAGILLGSIVHELAVIRELGAPLAAIDYATAWPGDAWPPSVEISGRTDGGGRVSIRWHFLEDYPAYREEVRLHDERGSIALTFPSPYLLHAPTDLTVVSRDDGLAQTARLRSTEEAFESQLASFHAMVVEGVPPRAGVAAGRQDILTCQAIAVRLAESLDSPIGGEATGP